MNRDLLLRMYAFLIRLHPAPFRTVFGPEITAVFAALLADVPPNAVRPLITLCARESFGLIRSLLREHWEAAVQLNPRRRIALGGLLIYALPLIVLSFAVYRSSPGPFSQEVLGVSIGRYNQSGGQVYISGRQLDCAPTTVDGFAQRCTIEIAGAMLELLARRNGPESMMQLSGECRAVYAGETWECAILSRHVHVHWFAYINEPLGLSDAELADVRRQYPLENAGEQPFLLSVLFVPLGSAVVIAWAVLLWFWGRPPLRIMAVSTVAGAMVWFFMFILTIRVTGGFWD